MPKKEISVANSVIWKIHNCALVPLRTFPEKKTVTTTFFSLKYRLLDKHIEHGTDDVTRI